MKRVLRRISKCLILSILFAVLISGCAFNTPCDSCGDTPSKGYTNESTGEKEYYCDECTDCDLCGDESEYHCVLISVGIRE